MPRPRRRRRQRRFRSPKAGRISLDDHPDAVEEALRGIATYAEGDQTLLDRDDDQTFSAEQHRIAGRHRKHNECKGIDAPDERMLARCVAAGAGDLIHRPNLEAWQARHEHPQSPTEAGN